MRVKEYLSVRGIGFESINVVEPAGAEALAALGARSLPVVACGERYVIAQVIRDVVEFLGLDEETGPRLSPAELAARFDAVLETAVRLTRQMPDDRLADMLPNRPRSWRELMHHIFQIPAAYLDAEEAGAVMSHESLVAGPPDALRRSEDIARFGEATRDRFQCWRDGAREADFDVTVEAYFGPTTRHELLERTVWHSTQHVRQLASLLERAGIAPDRPLSAADLAGLPLTERIWDEG